MTHPVWTTQVFIACAFAAWLWRMLRLATGSIAAPVVNHIIADVSIALAVQLKTFA